MPDALPTAGPRAREEGRAKILFTHSYFLRFDPKEWRAMMPYPPLGTLYAAAYLRTLGYSVALFDAMLAASEDDLRPALEKHRPSILVIYDDDFNYLTKMCLERMREAAFRMSAIGKEFGCTVIVHGSDPADHVASYLAHGADYVVIGEGEATLGELIGSLAGPDGPERASIPGLAYRDRGEIVRTPKRPVLHDLDALPFPARDLADMELYRRTWRGRHGYASVNLVTTRGCPFHCNWCAKPLYGQVYHSRTPENVVEELLAVKAAFAPDHVWFCDDIFGLTPGWIERFADAVVARGALIPYKCLSRADLLLKDDTVRHLARSGCRTVWIGAESGSQKILDAMEKGTTTAQIRQASALLRKHGIEVGFFLQYGYPGELREDIEETLRMVRECLPDDIGISVSYPLPGTPFYESVKRQLGEKQNWRDSQDLDLMYQGTFVPDFYRVLHRLTHRKFRLWQGLRLLRGEILRLRRSEARRILLMPYYLAAIPILQYRLSRLARQSAGAHARSGN
jgi:anaerobic magnesium-protoporphyrin IX monomethyl ester cyclase